MPKHAVNRHLDKDMDLMEYLVLDVKVTSCIIRCNSLFKIQYNSDKACFGPAPGGRKITIIRTRSHRGNAPYDFDTGINYRFFTGEIAILNIKNSLIE